MSEALILASASPRRRELLLQAGFTFEVRVAGIDESRLPEEPPQTYVQRLASEKARAVALAFPSATVLGADTTVVLQGQVLNKPTGYGDAERMLRLLSGKTHTVHTGIAVARGEQIHAHVETTAVTFRDIAEEELRIYLDSGDPLDKAGAYGIQGYAARWIPRIEGDYFNVVGLPISAVVRLLAHI